MAWDMSNASANISWGLSMKQSGLWREETAKLQAIIRSAKLEENIKWGLPCYSYNGHNVVIVQPFKACLALMFFKGALLKDPKKLLVSQGPNSQAALRLEFRSVAEVVKRAAVVKAYVKEAIAIEASGKKVEFSKKLAAIPAELKTIFSKKPKVEKAFKSLTPGRQRAYILHFTGAKQSATRLSRIEKCIPKILAGKGMMDR